MGVLSALPVTVEEADVQTESQLNLARQIGKMATRIDRRFLATSDILLLLCGIVIHWAFGRSGILDVADF